MCGCGGVNYLFVCIAQALLEKSIREIISCEVQPQTEKLTVSSLYWRLQSTRCQHWFLLIGCPALEKEKSDQEGGAYLTFGGTGGRGGGLGLWSRGIVLDSIGGLGGHREERREERKREADVR